MIRTAASLLVGQEAAITANADDVLAAASGTEQEQPVNYGAAVHREVPHSDDTTASDDAEAAPAAGIVAVDNHLGRLDELQGDPEHGLAGAASSRAVHAAAAYPYEAQQEVCWPSAVARVASECFRTERRWARREAVQVQARMVHRPLARYPDTADSPGASTWILPCPAHPSSSTSFGHRSCSDRRRQRL